ncbi:MAG: hypothetical protein RBU37_09315 [Myxococcota bacterium]|nr:hypothetical protein [Myxococcota bacterium]
MPPQRVLDHTITAVYQLDPVQLTDELKDALAQDQIFETDFTYRDGYERNTAFLLGNDEGYFILVGQAHGLDFIHAETQAVEEEAVEEEEEDELDFSMM